LVENRHFFHSPLHSTPPLGVFPSEYRHPVWYGKTRMAWLPDCEKISKISLFFGATHERNRRTDRQTDTACHHIPRLCIASRGNHTSLITLASPRLWITSRLISSLASLVPIHLFMHMLIATSTTYQLLHVPLISVLCLSVCLSVCL